jgi:alcohol dehydrogenase class IV
MSSPLVGNWNYPTAVRFGAGRIAELPAACAGLGLARPLLVTDRNLAALPMVEGALAACRAEGLGAGQFADFGGDPTGADVAAGVAALKAGSHDGVIAFGGGAALDAGKAVAFAAGQTRPLWDFEDVGDNWSRADAAAILPVVAVPTTAGTGSEVGRAAVIKDEAAKVKRIIFHPRMLPAVVIADPALTIALPAHVTAAVGMDALSHNLEAYFAPPYHPLARGIAAEGARLVRRWLPVAVREPTNLDARAHMLAAAEAGAAAFQRGLGAMHALAHPLGAVYGTHHGLLNAVLMPYVLTANRPAIAADAAALARYLDVGASAEDLIAWVLDLRREIGIPHSLAEAGVGRDVALIARMATEDPSGGTNPIPLAAADYARILEAALAGDVAAAA